MPTSTVPLMMSEKVAMMDKSQFHLVSDPTNESLLTSLLPSLVKSRIPRLSSLRRTMRILSTQTSSKPPRRPVSPWSYSHSSAAGSVINLYQHPHAGHSREVITEEQYRALDRPYTPSVLPSLSHSPSPSAASSRPETPGIPLEGDHALAHAEGNTEMDGRARSRSLASGVAASLQLSHAHPNPVDHQEEANWRHNAVALATAQGLVQVASTPASPPELRKTLIIDAIKYLCQSLPSDLSDAEVERFHGSLPGRVQTYKPSGKEVEAPRSSLRILVGSVLTQLFLLVAFLIPRVLCLLDAIYRFERQNQISERAIIAVLGFLTVCGDKSVNVQKAVDNFGHSKMGGYVVSGIQWTWQGVVGGIGDGVSDGWHILHDRISGEGPA